MERLIGFEEAHEGFRARFRSFLAQNAISFISEWERAGLVDRQLFTAAGENGFLGVDVPELYGGSGLRDFRYNQIMNEEMQRAGLGGAGLALSLHNDNCIPYYLDLATTEQKERWLSDICRGELITAIAMTEPGSGSDLASIRTTAVLKDGDFVVNGTKSFVTNGINADLVIVAVKTDPEAGHRGMSLLVAERAMEGFERGPKLDKIGLFSQDTVDYTFTDARVPAANLLGREGDGFRHLMEHLPRERLSLAISGVASAKAVLDASISYASEREAFGGRLSDLQNTRFKLAELATEVRIGQAFVDQCVLALNERQLSVEDAAMAKWWCTELQGRAADTAVQIHGGTGYLRDTRVARAFVDARVTRIFGGATEIMKEIIGRNLFKRPR